MTRERLSVLFLVALTMWSLALLPLRLVLQPWGPAQAPIDANRDAPVKPRGIAALDVSGSLWHGRVRGASWRGLELGDMSVALQPWPLLVGVRRFELRTPDLSGAILRGRIDGIEQVTGGITLDRIEPMPRLQLAIHLRSFSLTFSQGGCRVAGGTLWIEAQVAGRNDPITLRGRPTCVDGQARIVLQSRGTPQVEATMHITGNGNYRLRTVVRDSKGGAKPGLQLAGFEPAAAGLSRVNEGSLLN